MGLAYFVAIVIGIPLGLLQAVRRNKPVDYVATAAAFIGNLKPRVLARNTFDLAVFGAAWAVSE